MIYKHAVVLIPQGGRAGGVGPDQIPFDAIVDAFRAFNLNTAVAIAGNEITRARLGAADPVGLRLNGNAARAVAKSDRAKAASMTSSGSDQWARPKQSV